MDGDEFFFLIVASVLGIWALARWYLKLFRLDQLVSRTWTNSLLAVVPVLCLIGVWPVLECVADPQVVQHPQYMLLFMMGAVLWFWGPMLALPVLGISPGLDALERANGPAAIVCASALAATTTVYASANIGTGPTIWTTLGPAALGTAAMVDAWFIHRLLSPAWEDVAVGRDPAAGVRLSALLLATAVIIAPPLAGDWVSAAATCNDLIRRSWPVLPLLVIAAVIDRFLSPTGNRPKPALLTAGLLAGSISIAAAAVVAVGMR